MSRPRRRRRPPLGDGVVCFRCGDGWTIHEDGGRCRAVDEDGRCPCHGFQFVDPEPAPLSYAGRS